MCVGGFGGVRSAVVAGKAGTCRMHQGKENPTAKDFPTGTLGCKEKVRGYGGTGVLATIRKIRVIDEEEGGQREKMGEGWDGEGGVSKAEEREGWIIPLYITSCFTV